MISWTVPALTPRNASKHMQGARETDSAWSTGKSTTRGVRETDSDWSTGKSTTRGVRESTGTNVLSHLSMGVHLEKLQDLTKGNGVRKHKQRHATQHTQMKRTSTGRCYTDLNLKETLHDRFGFPFKTQQHLRLCKMSVQWKASLRVFSLHANLKGQFHMALTWSAVIPFL